MLVEKKCWSKRNNERMKEMLIEKKDRKKERNVGRKEITKE